MAIYVNGKKVAGRGVSGKSPYQIAKSEGYTGTEAEFNAQLAAIGEAVAGFDELSSQVENAKADIEAAVVAAETTVAQALEDIDAAKEDIDSAVATATSTIDTKVETAKKEIDDKVADALAQIPDSENLATKAYVQEQLENVSVDLTGYATEEYVNEAVANVQVDLTGYATETWVNTQLSGIISEVFYVHATNSPDYGYSGEEAEKRRKLLWIHTNSTSGGLKYYNGSSWVHVPVAWT